MKILVVSQYYSPEPFRINEICEELAKRGHAITVLTGIPNYPDGEIYPGYEKGHRDEVINGVRVIRCRIRPRKKGSVNLMLNYLSFWYKGGLAVRNLPNDYDVVYSYQLSPITSSSPACWYSKKYHKPHFLYCLDIWPESVIKNISPKSPVYRFILRLSRQIYSSADKIGVTSPTFIDYLSNIINCTKDKIVYIPQHARDIALHNDAQHHELLNIVFTGNIGASQNLDVLIDAVNLIKDFSGYIVTIVGSGSELDRLKEKVKVLGLEKLISFEGRRPKEKMLDYYKMADFCFLSLRDEGFVSWTIPGKLQEYMSAGKPILAAVNGDARFVIEDAKCGVCVGPNDSKGISQQILYYINNREALTFYGLNSRNYFEKNFTLTNYIDKIESELYKLTKTV